MPAEKREKQARIELYRLILDRCYRANLIKNAVNVDKLDQNLFENEEDMDNYLVNLLQPRVIRLLDRSLFDLYQVLYSIDVDEQDFKNRIMDLENTTMIPSIATFMIVDRLKERYKAYPLLSNPTQSLQD